MKTMKHLLIGTAFSLLALAPASVAAAGSASLNMSGSGVTHNVGTTFSVVITENSGAEAVNVVEANLVYDSNVLQLTGISCSGGFEISTPASASGIACGTTAPKTGMQTVGSASFKVLAAGTGTASFSASSAIYSSTTNANIWNGAANGVSFPLATPAPAKPRVTAPVVTAPVVETPLAQEAPKTVVKAAPKQEVNNPVKPTAAQTAVSGMRRILGYLDLLAIATAVIIFVSRRRQMAAEAAAVVTKKTKKTPAKA